MEEGSWLAEGEEAASATTLSRSSLSEGETRLEKILRSTRSTSIVFRVDTQRVVVATVRRRNVYNNISSWLHPRDMECSRLTAQSCSVHPEILKVALGRSSRFQNLRHVHIPRDALEYHASEDRSTMLLPSDARVLRILYLHLNTQKLRVSRPIELTFTCLGCLRHNTLFDSGNISCR